MKLYNILMYVAAVVVIFGASSMAQAQEHNWAPPQGQFIATQPMPAHVPEVRVAVRMSRIARSGRIPRFATNVKTEELIKLAIEGYLGEISSTARGVNFITVEGDPKKSIEAIRFIEKSGYFDPTTPSNPELGNLYSPTIVVEVNGSLAQRKSSDNYNLRHKKVSGSYSQEHEYYTCTLQANVVFLNRGQVLRRTQRVIVTRRNKTEQRIVGGASKNRFLSRLLGSGIDLDREYGSEGLTLAEEVLDQAGLELAMKVAEVVPHNLPNPVSVSDQLRATLSADRCEIAVTGNSQYVANLLDRTHERVKVPLLWTTGSGSRREVVSTYTWGVPRIEAGGIYITLSKGELPKEYALDTPGLIRSLSYQK